MPLLIGILAVIGWIAIQMYWGKKKEDKEKEEFEEKVRDNNLVDSSIDELYNFETHRINSKMKINNLFIGSPVGDFFSLLADIINAQIAWPHYKLEELKSIPYFIFILQDYINENIDLFKNDEVGSVRLNERNIEIESFGESLIEYLEKQSKKKIFQRSPSSYFTKFSKIKEDNPDNYLEKLDFHLIDFIKENLAFNEHLTSDNNRNIITAPRMDGIVNETIWIWREILKGTTIHELRTYYTPFINNSDIIRFRGYPHGKAIHQ